MLLKNLYPIIQKILFALPPETAHTLALRGLKLAHFLKCMPSISFSQQPINCMGLHFPNRIGLAAGFDKNGECIDALSALGFGFLEIGSVTPKAQTGNSKPRLFRLIEDKAIINRMGFNNHGMDYLKNQVEKCSYSGILGINLGKNRDTPNELAIQDYLYGMNALWQKASYFTINLSSPNTPGLRALQQKESLHALLSTLKIQQSKLADHHKRYVPLTVKLAPDLNAQELEDAANVILNTHMDGVIATNTTLSRPSLISAFAKESGGLSGRPLNSLSTQCIVQLHKLLQNKIPIIASGGIMDLASAQEKLDAGAALLQIYSGWIYDPLLIQKLAVL